MSKSFLSLTQVFCRPTAAHRTQRAQSPVNGVRQASLAAALALGLLLCACDPTPSAAQAAPAETSRSDIAAPSSSTSTRAASSALATNPYAKTPSQDGAGAALAAPAASSPDVPKPLLAHLEKGRPYSAFRRQALVDGWQPVVTAMCKANVAGGDYKSLCASHPKLNSGHLCDQMPELNACSGDGYCTMQFRHAGTPQIMQVNTYGDTRDWMHANSGLLVTDWAFSKTPEQ
jgi:hypothetical protein